MRLKKLFVRMLLSLYPAAWRKEYGEEMRSMLLDQRLTAPEVGDVFLNAARENFRRPDAWRIALLILVLWRTSWILWASISGLSPEVWPPFVQVDCAVFLLVAFATGCWTTINEGSIRRGVGYGWFSIVMAVNLAPFAATLLLFALAPHQTIPPWASEADRFDTHPHADDYDLTLTVSRVLSALCGALLGHVISKRAKSRPKPQPSR